MSKIELWDELIKIMGLYDIDPQRRAAYEYMMQLMWNFFDSSVLEEFIEYVREEYEC